MLILGCEWQPPPMFPYIGAPFKTFPLNMKRLWCHREVTSNLQIQKATEIFKLSN
jgi:hypothetical protein